MILMFEYQLNIKIFIADQSNIPPPSTIKAQVAIVSTGMQPNTFSHCDQSHRWFWSKSSIAPSSYIYKLCKYHHFQIINASILSTWPWLIIEFLLEFSEADNLTIWQFDNLWEKITKMSLGRYAMHLLFIRYAPDMLHLIISDWYCTLSANNLLKLLDSDMKLRLLVPYAPCVAVHIMHLIGIEPCPRFRPFVEAVGQLQARTPCKEKWARKKMVEVGEVTICQKSLDATSASE